MRSVLYFTSWVLALAGLIALPQAARAANGPTITIPNADLGFYTTGTVEIPLRATGTGTLTWSVTSGTLPPGLVLRTDVPGAFPVDANTGIIGVATAPGDYPFTVRATDANGPATMDVTVHITNENFQELSNLPDAVSGQAYSFPLHVLNGTTPVISLVGSLPQGIQNMTVGGGGVTGTPSAAGSYSFQAQITDGSVTVIRTFTLFVAGPYVTVAGEANGVLANATQGASYSKAVTGSGGSGSGYTFQLMNGNLPAGLSLSGGLIAGNVANFAGTGRYAFSIQVTDGASASYTRLFSIDVLGTPPVLPAIQTTGLNDATIGNPYTATIAASGGVAPYTWNVAGLPAGLLFHTTQTQNFVTPGDVQIRGIPQVTGSYPITITATDSNGVSVSAPLSIYVATLGITSSVNDSAVLNTALSPAIPIRIVGGRPPYYAVITTGSFPAGLTLAAGPNASGSSVSGTPLENGGFNAYLTFVDSDSQNLGFRTSINVNVSNPANISINNQSSLGYYTSGASVNVTLTACCLNPATYVWDYDSLPPGLSLDASTGVLSGTAGAAGTYTFLVDAKNPNDLSKTGLKEFTITFTPLSITTNSLPFGNVGTPYNNGVDITFGIAGNQSPPLWLVSSGTLPPGLNLSTSSGVLSGTPTVTGQYNFTVTALDAAAHPTVSVQKNFSIAVYPGGSGPPVAITDSGALGTNTLGDFEYPLDHAATGGSGSFTWTLDSGTLPPGIALRTDFADVGSSIALAGVANTTGDYAFTLKAASGAQFATKQFTMRVTALNVTDSFNLPDAYTGSPYTYTLTPVHATGNVTYAYNPSGSNLPSWVSVPELANGKITGTPSNESSGYFSIAISDDTGTIFRSFNLTSHQIHITNAGRLPNGAGGQAYSVTLTSTGGTGTVTYTASGLPSGLSIVAGVIAGTVDPNASAGLYPVEITATDSGSASITQNFSIDVEATNGQLPEISYPDPDDAIVGQPYSWTFNPCCGGVAPFTWTAQGLPDGLSIRYEGAGSSGAASGSPLSSVTPGAVEVYGVAKTPGSSTVTLTLTDSQSQSTSVSFALQVAVLDIVPSLPDGTVGQDYSVVQHIIGGTGFEGSIGGVNAPGGPLVDYSAGGPPTGGWLGLLEGLPDALIASTSQGTGLLTAGTPLEAGSFSGIYTAADDGGHSLRKTNFYTINNPQGVTISINTGRNLGAAAPNVSYSLQLSATGAASITWSIADLALPPGLTLSANGLVSGTPTTPGNYTFLAKAAETGNPSNASYRAFMLVVTPIQITTTSLPSGTLLTDYSGSLAATGETGALTWTVGTGSRLPPGLSLDPTTGAISGAPGGRGQYLTTFTVTDSRGNRTSAGLTINVFDAGGPPVSFLTGSNLGVWSLGEDQIELQAAGGNGVYVWSLQSGSLPPGFSIRTDKPSFFSGAASAGLIGVATTPGAYTFTLKVASGQQSATGEFTIKIASLTMQDLFNLPDGYSLTDYSYKLTPLNAAQGSTPVFSTAQGTCAGNSTECLPPGLTLGTDGSITGQPTTPGSWNFSVSVDDGTAKVSRFYTIQTYLIDITTQSLPNATQGTAYNSGDLIESGAESVNWSASGLPNGFAIDSSTGAITAPGNFMAGPGRYSVTVTATEQGTGTSSVRRYLLNIAGVPATLPQITVNGPYLDDATAGWPYDATFAMNNGGTAPFTYFAKGLPPGMSIRPAIPTQSNGGIIQGDVELWGVATATGSFDVTIQATDANNFSTSNIFKLNVSPLIQDTGLPRGTIGTDYNPGSTPNLRIVGGSGLYSVTKTVTGFLPAGLTRNGLTISGTPLETGDFNVTYQFADATQPQANTYVHTNYFTIANTLNNPVGINTPADLGSTTINVPYSKTFNACCGNFTWEQAEQNGGTLPPGLTVSGDGILHGTPTTAGTYAFVLEAFDGEHSAFHQFFLNVTPLNLSTNTNLTFGIVGTAYPGVTLTATGAAGAVTWSVNPNSYLPPGISLTGNSIGGNPTAAGHYSFTLTATDTATPSPNVLAKTFSIDIYPEGSAPPLSFSLNSSYGPWTIGPNSIVLSATGGAPPYTFSFTPSANTVTGCNISNRGPMPTNFSQGVTAGLLCVVTTAASTSTTIRVTDSNSNTFDRATTITVSPLMLEMQSSLPRATVGVAYTYDPAAGGGVAALGGSGAYTFSAANLPGGLSINGSTGVISGTPAAAGNFNPTITLGNASVTGATQTQVALNVNASTISPTSLAATAGQTYSTALTAPNCGSGCTWNAPNGLPSGFTLNTNTGVFSTTQGNVATSTDTSFVVQATGSSGTSQQVISLVVAPNAITALSITTTIPTTAPLGSAQNVGLYAAGGKPPYTFSVSAGQLPPGLSLQGPGDQIGFLVPGHQYLAGRPVFASSYSFTLTVTDSTPGTPLTASQDYTWTVSPLSIQYTNLPLTNTSLLYNTPYSQLLLAMGGSGHYSGWTSESKLQRGLRLDSASGLLSGTPLATGQISTIISVNDGAGGTAATSVNVNVNSNANTTLSLGGPASPTVQALGFTGIYNLNPNGGTPPYTITPVDPLPPGVILESLNSLGSTVGTSQYEMQATFSTPGTYSFTVKAVDSSATPITGARTYTISVPDFAPPVLTTLPAGSKDVPYSQQLYAFGNGTWAVDAGSALPPGLFVSAAGVLSGTPSATGVYAFSLTVSDTTGTLHQAFTMQISALSISSTQALPPAAIGVPYGAGSGVPLASSGGNGTTTWTLTSGQLPDGLALSNTGIISGTPTGANSSTFYTFTVTASNTSGQIAKQFSIFETQTNPLNLDYPIFQTFMNDATLGQNYVWTLQPDGGVPDYSWSVANGSALPDGLHLAPATLVSTSSGPGVTAIAGTPTTPGLYFFDLVLTDSTSATITRTFTLNVTPLSITVGNPKNAVQDQPYSFQLQATGGTGPYTFALQPNPSQFGQDLLPPGLTMDSTGLISGTPHGTGSYQFAVQVTDSAQHTITNLLSIASNLGNESIQARNQDLNLNSPINIPLTVLGSASTYTWSVEATSPAPAPPVQSSLPAGVQLVSNQGGTFIQGPATAPGTYTFLVKATNAGNPADVVKRQLTVRITPLSFVAPVQNGLFSPTLPIATVGTHYSFTLKAAGGGGTYTFSRAPNAPMPPGLGIDINGVLSGTPTQSGVFTLHPSVADSAGDATDVNLSVTLVVLPPGGHAPLESQSKTGISDASIGVPYALMLDRLVLPASGPLTWTVTSGSLPAGVSILPGSNGLSSILAGISNTAGQAGSFTLHVADTNGQSLDFPVNNFNISPLTFTPDSIPNAVKGTSYSLFIAVQGGTAPYGVRFVQGMTPPPGMSIQGGLFTGTPTYAGVFPIGLVATDKNGATVTKYYDFSVDDPTVDKPIGAVTSLSVTPKPVNVLEIEGQSATSTPIRVNSSSGALPFTAALYGIPGASLATSSGTTNTSLTLDYSGLSAGNYAGFAAALSPNAVNLVDVTPVFISVLPPPPCVYLLKTSTTSSPIGGDSGTIEISTGDACAWTAAPAGDSSWITLTNATSGTGSGKVTYATAANGTGSARTGTVNISGSTNSPVFTINQFSTGCSFSLSPSSISTGSAGGTATVGITASGSSCSWATGAELTVAPTTGAGTATVDVTIPANANASPTVRTATIAGKTLTINQTGVNCTYALSAHSTLFDSNGGSGSVDVTAPNGCPYNTILGPSWINVTSGASGTGSGSAQSLVYSVDASSTTAPRTGALIIGGQVYAITEQALTCSVSVDTSQLGSPFPSGGGSGTIAITTNGPNCPWRALSNSGFAQAIPGGGLGSGNLTVNVNSNAGSTTPRPGSVTISGQTINFTQAGTACTFVLRSTGSNMPPIGGAGNVTVVAPAACNWDASANASWLHIVAKGTNGTADVSFTADANTSQTPRSGTLTMAFQTFTVSEGGAPCSYTLASQSSGILANTTVQNLTVNYTASAANCPAPAVASFSSWIGVTNSYTAPDGTVTYGTEANTSGNQRAGNVQVGDKVFHLVQNAAAGACQYSLNSYGLAVDYQGTSSSFTAAANQGSCTSPPAGTNQPFITLDSLTGDPTEFTQPFTVEAFSSANKSVRTGYITFGGVLFYIKQTSF